MNDKVSTSTDKGVKSSGTGGGMDAITVLRAVYVLFVYGSYAYKPEVLLLLFPLHAAFYQFTLLEYYPDMSLPRAFVTLALQNFGDAFLYHYLLGFPIPGNIIRNSIICLLVFSALVAVSRKTLISMIKNQWFRTLLFASEGVYKGVGHIGTVNAVAIPRGQPIMGMWKFAYSSFVLVLDAMVTGQKTFKNFNLKFWWDKAVTGFWVTLVIMVLPNLELAPYANLIINAYLLYSFTENSRLAPAAPVKPEVK